MVDRKRFKIIVSGKVQGVWYRKSTLEKAKTFGLTGFVCNQNDGKVYMEAEGKQQQVDLLLNWCRQGPEHAEVKNVEFSEVEVENSTIFKIVY